MSRKAEDLNRRLLRARDAIDRAYAQPLDVPAKSLRKQGFTDFTQEPAEHFYGTDMGLRDPFGNAVRILQQGTGR